MRGLVFFTVFFCITLVFCASEEEIPEGECPVGTVWVKEKIKYECFSDGNITGFRPLACMPSNDLDSVEVQPGQTWSDCKFKYICNQTDPLEMSFTIIACKIPTNPRREIAVGSSQAVPLKGIYHCVQNSDGGVTRKLQPGCIYKQQLHQCGTTWSDGDIQLNCYSGNNGYEAKPSGCTTADGTAVKVNTYTVIKKYYQCQIQDDHTNSTLSEITEEEYIRAIADKTTATSKTPEASSTNPSTAASTSARIVSVPLTTVKPFITTEIKRTTVPPQPPTAPPKTCADIVDRLGLSFSYAGTVRGKHCISMYEPSDPNTWSDNFLCFNNDYGVIWNIAGPIGSMTCTQIMEPADPHAWNDNYLCVPSGNSWRFLWSHAGPINGKCCIQIIEPSDPHTWNDNYLCVDGTVSTAPQRSPVSVERLGLSFSYAGAVRGKHCISMNEPADPHTWNDNFLCFNKDYGVHWNTAGPIGSMTCTQILEAADPHTWNDNYLCVPSGTSWRFLWSSAGTIRGKSCIQILEPSDPHTWNDNYLCVDGLL